MLLSCLLFLLVPALAQDEAPPEPSAEATSREGPSRMVFDDRLVRGEAAGGAVAITQRPPRALAPLVAERVSFLPWTVHPVLGAPPLEDPEPPPTSTRTARPAGGMTLPDGADPDATDAEAPAGPVEAESR